jgi:hypothetical protein
MFKLHAGECEHCSGTYRYSLWHSGFGETSYAYCDTCGQLATCATARFFPAMTPPHSPTYQVIEEEWESLLAPCSCGGSFRQNASPRCVFCQKNLSAEHAAGHIERNSLGASKGWRWQRNWNGIYCIVMEDPKMPGALRQMIDPFARPWEAPKRKPLMRWPQMLSFSR